MKNDHLQTDLRPRDEHSPVVIHHEEDNRTDLERWLRGLTDKGPGLWGWLAVAVVLIGLLAYGLPSLSGGDSRSKAAWKELLEANSTEDIQGVAEKFPDTKAENWALLRSAAGNFNDGVTKLPGQIDAARPYLSKAQQQYQDVLDKSTRDTPEARIALFGLARTLEVRNEPDQAIAQYKKVVDAYPDSQEGRLARRNVELLQAELKKPEAERFYTKLYAYKPSALPGIGDLPLIPGSSLDNPGSRLPDFLKEKIGGEAPSGLPPLFEDQPKTQVPPADPTPSPTPDPAEPAKAGDPPATDPKS